MPIYEYECGCGQAFERFLPLSEYDHPQACRCGQIAKKVLSAPQVSADYAGYQCPVTGQWIEGKRAHRENLRRQGCHEYDPGELTAAKRFQEAQDKALERSVSDSIDASLERMSARDKERLEAEVKSGADLQYTRGA